MKIIKYVIKSGKHYSRKFLNFIITFKNKIDVKYSISSASLYNYEKIENGWSKIIGLSDYINPHKNSCRIAFIHDKYGLKVGSYVYSNGVRQMNTITTISPGKLYNIKIERTKEGYILSHSNEDITSTTFIKSPRKILPFQFILHPYVGGKFTLDRDLLVKIYK